MLIKPWVRLVIAVSLDGRLAFSEGGKKNLGQEGDRKVLEDSLAWSDATLMGSRTLKEHTNTCLIHNPKLRKRRVQKGMTKQPRSIIVSENGIFWTIPFECVQNSSTEALKISLFSDTAVAAM